jgi:hypothetical protein
VVTGPDLTGRAAPPRDNGELVFAAPWEGRVFGLAIETVRSLGLEWDAFRRVLVAAIAEDPARPYYESWLEALETLTVNHTTDDG